jgi:FtsH-binding integral membrane protein
MTANITLVNKDVSVLTKNRIVAPIVLGIAIFVGIFFTRPLYLEYIDSEANIMKLE